MSNDNVIKTEPNNGKTRAKTESQVNDLVPIATSSTNESGNETIVIQQQDCVVSAGEVTECSGTWVILERVVLKLDDRDILLNELCLNDEHMLYMQLLLKRQYSSV